MKKFSSVFPVWLLITVTIVVILLIIFFFFIYDLNTLKTAKGFEDEIYVVADSAEYSNLKDDLSHAFEKEILTPQPEKTFTLIQVDPEEISKYKEKKNIVIAAPLNSESNTANLVKEIVDSTSIQKLESDSGYIDYQSDVWAKGQLVTILSAPSMEGLESKISQNSDELHRTYQKSSDERLLANIYNPTDEQIKVQGNFLKDYGWVIYVQPEFKVARNNPAEKFVLLQKKSGDELESWIFIHWIDDANPEYITEDSIMNIRHELTKKFFSIADDTSQVVVAENNYTNNEINFNGRYAIFTQGLWELDVNGMNGPFVNYIFFDEASGRVYMLDGSVYAPKHLKRNLIQQLDVTLQSFRTADELLPARKNELLNKTNE